MPTDPQEWLWFLFSVVFLSLLLGVGANFIHESLRERIKNWQDDRRRKAREKDANRKEEFENDVQMLLSNRYYVTRCYHRIAVWDRAQVHSLNVSLIIIVTTVLVATIFFSTSLPDLFLHFFLLASGSFYFFNMLAYRRVRRWVRYYQDVIDEYERRKFKNDTDDNER